MARRRNKPGLGFKVFAIGMAVIFGLGSILVLGVSIFGDSGGGRHDPASVATTDPGIEQIATLLTAVAEDPEDYASAGLLANILASSGRSAESLEFFEIAVTGQPDDGSLRLLYGIALFRTGNTFDAEVQLKKALELDEDRADPAYYLGQLYENQNEPDLEQAVVWYERAIEIGPEDSLVAQQAQERIDIIESDPTQIP